MPKLAYVTEKLPREVVPGLWWLGGCSSSDGWPGLEDRTPISHEPTSAWLVMGTEKTLLVDGGHPGHWYALPAQLRQALGGRQLDYVFPTHPELPHSGNIGRWLMMYPGAVGVGDMRDYHLFHPQISRERWIDKRAEDSVDLGGSRFVFLDAIWKDLTATMWGYDTRTKSLFSADGVGFMHEHEPHVCGLFASELPPEIQPGDRTRFALPFVGMAYQDMAPSIEAFRALLRTHPVDIICSSHGAPVQRGPHFAGFLEQLYRDTVDPNRVIGRLRRTEAINA